MPSLSASDLKNTKNGHKWGTFGHKTDAKLVQKRDENKPKKQIKTESVTKNAPQLPAVNEFWSQFSGLTNPQHFYLTWSLVHLFSNTRLSQKRIISTSLQACQMSDLYFWFGTNLNNFSSMATGKAHIFFHMSA